MDIEKEIDIEELKAILGIENKTSDINALFSKQDSSPKSFLQAISTISNSGQFGDVQADQHDDSSIPTTATPTQDSNIQNLVKKAVDFFSQENKEKLKIDFTKPIKEEPSEEFEMTIQETIINQNKNQTGNKNKNNINNNNNNNNNNQKDEKEKNKKNKKKK